jgi:hypothetical protein
MQTNTTQPGGTLRGLLFALTGLLLVLDVGNAMAQNMTVRNNTISWTLSEGQLLEMGTTISMPNGTMSTGYVLEAVAESTDTSLLAKGTLRLSLTAFSPKKDSRMQKAGIWYVRGKWSLSDVDAPPVSNPRYTPGVFGGQFQVELPFNPVDSHGDWSASLRLPQTTMEPVSAEQGRQPMRGTGTLIFDDKLGGELTLKLKLWPRI